MKFVTINGRAYPIHGEDRYGKIYWSYGSYSCAADYDTPEEAARALNYGEEYEQLSAVGVYDTKTETVLAQNETEHEPGFVVPGTDWLRAIALEAVFRKVGTETSNEIEG